MQRNVDVLHRELKGEGLDHPVCMICMLQNVERVWVPAVFYECDM